MLEVPGNPQNCYREQRIEVLRTHEPKRVQRVPGSRRAQEENAELAEVTPERSPGFLKSINHPIHHPDYSVIRRITD